jgi:hypothetical protein
MDKLIALTEVAFCFNSKQTVISVAFKSYLKALKKTAEIPEGAI